MAEPTIELIHLYGDFPQSLLDAFVDLYRATFTDLTEFEDPRQWREHLRVIPATPQPRLNVLLATVADTQGPRVVGGLVFEYYRESRCGLMTYMAIDSNYRRRGLARRLRQAATATLHEQAREAGHTLNAVFAETEDPNLVSTESGGILPYQRLAVWARLGVRRVDLNYVQPTLVGGIGPSRNLLLLACPLDDEVPARLPATVVRNFLHEFYRALNIANPEQNGDFIAMTRELQQWEWVALEQLRNEQPVIVLPRAAVALHYVEYTAPELHRPTTYPNDPQFMSMELDLLAYQFQKLPPLGSRTHISAPLPLKIEFPATLRYQTEGQTFVLVCRKVALDAQVTLSSTEFLQSGLRVWHVVITPGENACFDEFDIIKLIHLYDGRAEYTRLQEAGAVKFTLQRDGGTETCNSTDALLQALRRDVAHVHAESSEKLVLTAGTVELVPSHDNSLEWLKQVRNAGADEKCADHTVVTGWINSNSDEARRLKAYAGIIIGIFDFEAVDMPELLDTLEPTFSYANQFLRIHRCTLTAISAGDRALDCSADTIGINPYLILPHALLLHNETLVEQAELLLDCAMNNKTNGLTVLEQRYQAADLNLNYFHLPNIFNYPTERALFEKGSVHRGSVDKRDMVLAKLGELKERIETGWHERDAEGQIEVTALLAIMPGVQLGNLIITSMESMELEKKLSEEFGRNFHIEFALLCGLVFGWLIYRRRRAGLRRKKK